MPIFGLVTTQDLNAAVAKLNKRIDQMATQAEVDAITAELGTVATDLASASTKLQAEIDALAQANPSLDLTALQAAAAPLDASVQALGNLVPSS
jgi:hypothetical protein